MNIMEKIRDLLIKSLTTRVAPMVYIMMFVSVVIGFCFMTNTFVDSGESVLFNAESHIVPVDVWGAMLFCTASVCEFGLLFKKWELVGLGGMGGFALWLMASIDLFQNAHWYAFMVLGMFHLLFHGYVYLAASLGVLERQAIRG